LFKVIKVSLGRCLLNLSYLEERILETANGRILRLLELVKERKKINRYEAYAIFDWTPGIYERVHPAFISRHSSLIIYENKTKDYVYTDSIQEKLI